MDSIRQSPEHNKILSDSSNKSYIDSSSLPNYAKVHSRQKVILAFASFLCVLYNSIVWFYNSIKIQEFFEICLTPNHNNHRVHSSRFFVILSISLIYLRCENTKPYFLA